MSRAIRVFVVLAALFGVMSPVVGLCCTQVMPAAGAHDCCPAPEPLRLESVRNCCPEGLPGDSRVTLTAVRVLVTPASAALPFVTGATSLSAAPAPSSSSTHLPAKPLVLRI